MKKLIMGILGMVLVDLLLLFSWYLGMGDLNPHPLLGVYFFILTCAGFGAGFTYKPEGK